jgi:hypothetical protein
MAMNKPSFVFDSHCNALCQQFFIGKLNRMILRSKQRVGWVRKYESPVEFAPSDTKRALPCSSGFSDDWTLPIRFDAGRDLAVAAACDHVVAAVAAAVGSPVGVSPAPKGT